MARPATVPTQMQISQALELSPGRVTQLKKRGMPVDSIAAARAWYQENVAGAGESANVLQFPVGDEMASYAAARAAREAAEARIAQLRLAELKGELIRVEAVRAMLASVLASTRDRLMQLPARLAPVLAAESDQGAVHDIVRDEIHAALAQLAETPQRVGVASAAVGAVEALA